MNPSPRSLTTSRFQPAPGLARRRLTVRNALALVRFLRLRLAHRRTLRCGLFFVDRGADLHIGPAADVELGARLRVMRDFTGHLHGRVRMGSDVFFNRGCHVVAHRELVIGDRSLFGEGVSIHDEDHAFGPELLETPLPARPMRTAPVRIGSDVWVGAKATIVAGVTLGDDVVVAAHSVVTRDVPPHSLVAGAPARVVRRWAPGERPAQRAPRVAEVVLCASSS